MDDDELRKLIIDETQKISYKPRSWITATFGPDVVRFACEFRVTDSYTGECTTIFKSRFVPIWHFMDNIKQTVFENVHGLIAEMEIHEMDEWLKRDGVVVNNPHASDIRLKSKLGVGS